MNQNTLKKFSSITEDIEALLNAVCISMDEISMDSDEATLTAADTAERLLNLAIVFTHGLSEDVADELAKHNDEEAAE